MRYRVSGAFNELTEHSTDGSKCFYYPDTNLIILLLLDFHILPWQFNWEQKEEKLVKANLQMH